MTKTVVQASIISAIGGLLFGYDIGIISGAILQLQEDFNLNCNEREMIVGIMLVGAIGGSIIGGYMIDKLGRKMTIFLNSIIFFAGALVMALARNYSTLIIGRVLIGYAVSVSAMAECVYVSEISPSNRRGSLITFNEFFITLGLLLAYLVNYIFINVPQGWRYMFGLSALPAGTLLICIIFVPKSPRWLLTRGKENEALETLQRIREIDDVSTELQQMQDSLSLEKVYTFRGLCRSGSKLRKRLLIVVFLALFQQLTGQPNILYYAPTIFKSIGFSNGSEATLATVGLGIIKMFFTFIILIGIDKIGRRRALIIGSTAITVSLLVLGVVSSSYSNIRKPCILNGSGDIIPGNGSISDNHETLGVKIVSLISLLVFVAAYAFGFGPVTWILISELFPPEIKGRASSIASLTNWLTNFLISFTFLDLSNSIGLSAVFFIYGGISFVSVMFIISQVPETKRKTLEDIATNTSKPNNALLTKWFGNRRAGQSLFTNEIVFQPSSSFERYSYREPPNGNLDLPESPTSPSPNFTNDNHLT